MRCGYIELPINIYTLFGPRTHILFCLCLQICDLGLLCYGGIYVRVLHCVLKSVSMVWWAVIVWHDEMGVKKKKMGVMETDVKCAKGAMCELNTARWTTKENYNRQSLSGIVRTRRSIFNRMLCSFITNRSFFFVWRRRRAQAEVDALRGGFTVFDQYEGDSGCSLPLNIFPIRKKFNFWNARWRFFLNCFRYVDIFWVAATFDRFS